MDGGAIWRRGLAQTGWDLFGYGFYHRAKLISKSVSYKKRNQSYMNRTEGLVLFQIETKLRSTAPLNPNPPLILLVRFRDHPFSLLLHLFL
jgi:hypothetical protein